MHRYTIEIIALRILEIIPSSSDNDEEKGTYVAGTIWADILHAIAAYMCT
jgi:hypothetical protein